MTFRVKKLNTRHRAWKVQKITYCGSDEKARDLDALEISQLGFSYSMTREEAKARAQLLNREAFRESITQKRLEIRERLSSEADRCARLFPLEADFFHWLDRRGLADQAKLSSHWHNAKKILSELNLSVIQLSEDQLILYRYFEKHRYSMGYLSKILLVLNRYGRFIASREKRYFEPITLPRGVVRQRIQDAYFKKAPKGKAARELTPNLLEAAKSALPEPQAKWLELSLWFGLRPSEVDALKDNHRVEEFKGKRVLWVYQPKLTAIDPSRRWKPIPILEPEQERALAHIQDDLRRPLVKTLQRHLGEGFNTYSGRKGFEQFMRDRGHPLENVSQWLGHQNIERTWKNYVSRRVPRF